jgi:hypothetical protein
MSEQKGAYKMRKQTIFRTMKNEDNPFVMIDRRPIENPALSWKAKGILAYLLSRPDNWIVRLGDLVKRSPDGVYAIRGAINELQKAGHVNRKAVRDTDGTFLRYELEVYELPFTSKPLIGFPQADNPQADNLVLNDTDINENEVNGADAPDLPLDWKISQGMKITPADLTDHKNRQKVDCANLIAMGMGVHSGAAYDLAYAFMVTRNIVIPEGKVKGNRKALREMLEMGVSPVHVANAVSQLMAKNLTVVDLFSVSKTAIDLAHKDTKPVEMTRLL